MSYIYDILLNFNKDFYDFFEWYKADVLTRVKKIPIFKVCSTDLKAFKYYLVKFDKSFTNLIYNKTIKFSKGVINYVVLFSDGKEVIGVKLNKNGLITERSSLLLYENDEVILSIGDLEITDIKYKIIKKAKIDYFKTRCEKEKQKFIFQKLNHIYKYHEIDKLKYLYLDCFNKKETNVDKIFDSLKKEIKHNKKSIDKINNFFQMIEQK